MEERNVGRGENMNKTVSKFVSSLIYVLFGLALILKPLLVEDLLCYLLAVVLRFLGAEILMESRILSGILSSVPMLTALFF
jgi:hypothetical protein